MPFGNDSSNKENSRPGFCKSTESLSLQFDSCINFIIPVFSQVLLEVLHMWILLRDIQLAISKRFTQLFKEKMTTEATGLTRSVISNMFYLTFWQL